MAFGANQAQQYDKFADGEMASKGPGLSGQSVGMAPPFKRNRISGAGTGGGGLMAATAQKPIKQAPPLNPTPPSKFGLGSIAKSPSPSGIEPFQGPRGGLVPARGGSLADIGQAGVGPSFAPGQGGRGGMAGGIAGPNAQPSMGPMDMFYGTGGMNPAPNYAERFTANGMPQPGPDMASRQRAAANVLHGRMNPGYGAYGGHFNGGRGGNPFSPGMAQPQPYGGGYGGGMGQPQPYGGGYGGIAGPNARPYGGGMRTLPDRDFMMQPQPYGPPRGGVGNRLFGGGVVNRFQPNAGGPGGGAAQPQPYGPPGGGGGAGGPYGPPGGGYGAPYSPPGGGAGSPYSPPGGGAGSPYGPPGGGNPGGPYGPPGGGGGMGGGYGGPAPGGGGMPGGK